MAKKNDNLLLYGLGAVALYFLVIKPKSAPVSLVPGNVIYPNSNGLLPVNTATTNTNNTNSLISSAASIIKQLLPGNSNPAPTPAVNNPATGFDSQAAQTIFALPPLSYNTNTYTPAPVSQPVYASNSDNPMEDYYYSQYQNGMISGLVKEALYTDGR